MSDLLWRHASVGVHHHDDVAGRSQEPGPERASLAGPVLGHHLDIGRYRRAVIRVASVELPSTRTISSTSSAICSSTQAMLRASFLTGMTRLPVGF
jgi:hypothetical protein